MHPPRPLWSKVARFRVAGAALVGWMLACGGRPDSGFSDCDAECPVWTRQLDGGDSDNECFSTCEPLVDCPSWGIPFITDACYTCTHVTETGALLPLVPNIGRGSLDQSCEDHSTAGLTHALMWIEERYEVDGDQVSGQLHVVWTSAEDDSVLCDVKYAAAQASDVEPCPECDVEAAMSLDFDSFTGDECDPVLRGGRLDFAVAVDGAILPFGYANTWTSWDARVHDDVMFRFDSELIYPPSTWIPYSQADVSDDGSGPMSIATHELWASEWVNLNVEPAFLGPSRIEFGRSAGEQARRAALERRQPPSPAAPLLHAIEQ